MTDFTELPIGPRRAAMGVHLAGAACAPLAIALPWLVTTQLSHGGIGAFIAPYLGLLLLVTEWTVVRLSHPFVDESGRHAVNFHLSMAVFVTIYGLVAALIVVSLCGSFNLNTAVTPASNMGLFVFFGSVVLLGFQGLFSVVLSFYGASRALGGHVYRYPFALNFFKARL
jgi:uncharacterized protein